MEVVPQAIEYSSCSKNGHNLQKCTCFQISHGCRSLSEFVLGTSLVFSHISLMKNVNLCSINTFKVRTCGKAIENVFNFFSRLVYNAIVYTRLVHYFQWLIKWFINLFCFYTIDVSKAFSHILYLYCSMGFIFLLIL